MNLANFVLSRNFSEESSYIRCVMYGVVLPWQGRTTLLIGPTTALGARDRVAEIQTPEPEP